MTAATDTPAIDPPVIDTLSAKDQQLQIKEMVQGLLTKASSNIFPIAVVSVAVFFVLGLFMAIWRAEKVIYPLQNAQYARGLITFLVVFATVLIAVILTLYVVLGNPGNDADQEKRFNRGKEVLTIFIGVLGTIVGFYFASTSASPDATRSLTTSPIVISNEQPKNGDTITIMSLVSGGTPPYNYSITFKPSNIIQNIQSVASPDGVIQESIPISSSIHSNTDVTFQIDIQDSAGKSTSREGKQMTVLPS
jgi:uncharacterized membrane protein